MASSGVIPLSPAVLPTYPSMHYRPKPPWPPGASLPSVVQQARCLSSVRPLELTKAEPSPSSPPPSLATPAGESPGAGDGDGNGRGVRVVAGVQAEDEANETEALRRVRRMFEEGELRSVQCLYQSQQHQLHLQVQTLRRADAQETVRVGKSCDNTST